MIKEFIELDNPNPYARRLNYYQDNEIKGYLDYSLIYDRIEIDNFFVEESRRCEGIGKKIMSYLVALAIRYRVVNITLEVRISNEVARELYKKFGFREIARRKFYYGNEDGILMEKQVM